MSVYFYRHIPRQQHSTPKRRLQSTSAPGPLCRLLSTSAPKELDRPHDAERLKCATIYVFTL